MPGQGNVSPNALSDTGRSDVKGALKLFKEEIIEMVRKITNADYLRRIYYFVKVKYDKENGGERD